MAVANPLEFGGTVESVTSGAVDLATLPSQIESLGDLNNDRQFLEGVGALVGIASIAAERIPNRLFPKSSG